MTEYEKLRAENMMRNNRRLQEMGINALVSMFRKSSNDHEGSAVTCDDSASGITQGSGSEYSPKDDEVSQQDESDDTSLKQVKVGVCEGGGYFVCFLFHVCFRFCSNNFSTHII